MKHLELAEAEGAFILVFGVMHVAIPFLLPPNFVSNTTVLGVLRIADFVLPGSFLVAVSSVLYYFTRSRYPGLFLAFLYSGGIVFHVLYLSGVFPAVLVVPSPFLLIGGILVDALSIGAIYDYYRQCLLIISGRSVLK